MHRLGWVAGVIMVLGVSGRVALGSEPVSLHSGEPVLEIWKGRREMVLREGDAIVQKFSIAIGRDPAGSKRYRGDNRTPVGEYYVSDKNPRSRFHRFLGLSYPNVADAERGYFQQLIDAGEWADIFLANLRRRAPRSETALGGRVGIHGYAGRPMLGIDWTEGCIAVSDQEIEYLYERVPVGSKVIIHE